MVYGKRLMRADMNLSGNRPNATGCVGSKPLATIIGMMLVVLLLGSSAFGDFLIQPIILKQQVSPGKRGVRLNLHLENLSRDTPEVVALRLGELTQNSSGVWIEARADDPENPVNISSLRSCRDWLTCDTQGTQLAPWQRTPVTIVANIPAGTRGFYFAALIAETVPREMVVNGVTSMTTLQYLVPIVLEAASTPLQHDIKLTNVGLTYVAPTLDNPTAQVLGSLEIVNNGGTYSRLQGTMRVWRQSTRGHWTKAADLTLPDSGIIPGVKLNLMQDLGVLLPSGKYKMEGYLVVDGRRGNAISEEIDFEGDRRVVDTRDLASIDLDKEELFIDILPGSIRQGSILVGNGCEDPVTVNAEFILPPHMLNIINGQGIKGDDLGCADWVTLQPSQFKLNGYGRRNLNVIVRMPATATKYSHYYGTLRLHTTYEDGSPAGTKTALVCLNNTKVAAENLIGSTTFTLAELTPSRYLVTAGFLNSGVTYVTPKCRGALTGPLSAIYKQFLMNSEAHGQTGILLPFETRAFSGILDISEIPPGTYRLTAVLEHGTRSAQNPGPATNTQNQMLIEVSEQGGQKTAKTVPWDQATDGTPGRTVIQL